MKFSNKSNRNKAYQKGQLKTIKIHFQYNWEWSLKQRWQSSSSSFLRCWFPIQTDQNTSVSWLSYLFSLIDRRTSNCINCFSVKKNLLSVLTNLMSYQDDIKSNLLSLNFKPRFEFWVIGRIHKPFGNFDTQLEKNKVKKSLKNTDRCSSNLLSCL